MILLSIWGFKFLLGQNALTSDQTFYVKYANVDGLRSSNPVQTNGVDIGSVVDVIIDPDNFDSVLVTLEIKKYVEVPKGSIATIVSPSAIGGKEIMMQLKGECCAESGDFLRGQTFGLLKSTVSPEEMDVYMNKLKNGFGGIVDTLTSLASGGEGENGKTVADLQATINNMVGITEKLNYLLGKSSKSLNATFENFATISGNLNGNEEKINGIIDNTKSLVEDFNKADLNNKISALESNVGNTLKELEVTLGKANTTFANLNSILTKINAGEGLLGQLTQDQDLYEKLTRVTSNVDLLLQDLRLNPKRYINVSVFGKKQKDYEVPENDPAFTEQSDKHN